MTGFEVYTAAIKEFEASKLFVEKYQVFLSSMARHEKESPVNSGAIEKALKISGPSVRALVRYARLKGIKIASDDSGYWLARNAWEIQDTIKHLRERSAILAVLANCLERGEAGTIENQLSLF